MKTRIYQSTILLCVVGALSAQPVQVVVPGNLATVEGNSAASEPFNSISFRFQQVFDASQFAIPPGTSGRIDRISFRVDGDATGDVLLFFGGSSVQLSTTQRTPDGLSPVFAENRGSDGLTIWNGALSVSGDPPSGMPPAPFNPVIPSDSPFYYIPSQGNLLLDVAASGGQAFLPGSLDAQLVVGDPVSRVFSLNGNSPTGTTDTLGLVTRFDITIIPEPAGGLLLMTGLVLVILLKRR